MTIQSSEAFLAAVLAKAEQSKTNLVDVRFLEPGLMLAWERDTYGGPMGPCLHFDQSMWQVKQETLDGNAEIDSVVRRQHGQPIVSLFADEIEAESLGEAARFAAENMQLSDALLTELSS